MMPDHADRHGLSLSTRAVSAMQRVASILGLVAGVLFTATFVLLRVREGEGHIGLLGLGVLFLFFPLLAKRLLS